MPNSRFHVPTIFILLSLTILSCNESDVVQPPIDYAAIDTITYSKHVQPILDKSCAYGGCHDIGTKSAGLNLTSWNGLIKGSAYGEAITDTIPGRSPISEAMDYRRGEERRRSEAVCLFRAQALCAQSGRRSHLRHRRR
jgi:hypothetical protein